MTKYEYEYYSVSQKWPNTNTNIIWHPNNDQIRISLGLPKMIKYYTAKYKFCWASQKEAPWYLFWVLQGDAKFAKSSDDWN